MSASTCGYECAISVMFVGMMWGVTNPLMRLGARYKDTIKKEDKPNKSWLKPVSDLISLFLCWRFSAPFLLNQTASVLFQMLVARFPLSVAVPAVNALQFVFTAITGHLIGEQSMSKRAIVGCLITSLGVSLMIVSDIHP